MDDKDKIPAASPEHGPLFDEMRASIANIPDGEKRELLLARLHHLESSMNSASFGDHVKALVEEAEEDAAALGPFMARLSSLLP